MLHHVTVMAVIRMAPLAPFAVRFQDGIEVIEVPANHAA